MKKTIIVLAAILMCANVYAKTISIDGRDVERVEQLEIDGQSTASVSKLNDCKLYYDIDDNKLKISEDGAAYTNISGGSGAFTETTDGAYLSGDVTITGSLSSSTAIKCNTLDFTGASEIQNLDAIDDTSETTFETELDHDDFTGFVAGEHENYTNGTATNDLRTKGDLSIDGNMSVAGYIYNVGGIKGDASGTSQVKMNATTINVIGDLSVSGSATVGGILLTGDSELITVLSSSDVVANGQDSPCMWVNDTGVTVYLHGIEGWAWGYDDTAFTLIEVDNDGAGNSTTIEACNCTTGSDPYTVDKVKSDIDHNTIENGHMILVDMDATDDPSKLTVKIKWKSTN